MPLLLCRDTNVILDAAGYFQPVELSRSPNIQKTKRGTSLVASMVCVGLT
jgi:hypothetical protein